MKRTRWLLLLLPACLLALWAWSVTRVTREQIENQPWRLDYCLPRPFAEEDEIGRLLNEAFPAKTNGSSAESSPPESGELAQDAPELYAALVARGLKLDATSDLKYEVQYGGYRDLVTISATVPLPQHQILHPILMGTTHYERDAPASGSPYILSSDGPWREREFAPRWLFGVVLSETIYWDTSRSHLRPTRRTELNYSALAPSNDFSYRYYIFHSRLEVGRQQTRCLMPLWVFAFILGLLPTPLIYFLRRPLARLLPARLRTRSTR